MSTRETDAGLSNRPLDDAWPSRARALHRAGWAGGSCVAVLVAVVVSCSGQAITPTLGDASLDAPGDAPRADAASDAGDGASDAPVDAPPLDACQGAACEAPVVSIANVSWAHGIELDGAYVYFTTSDFAANAINVVSRAPKSGGNAQTLASPEAAPQHLAVRAGNAYWTNWHEPIVRAVDPTSPSSTLRTVVDLTGVAAGLFGIATTDTELFVGSNSARYVYRLPLSGSVADAGALDATKIGNPTGLPPQGAVNQIATVGDWLFWAAQGRDGVQSAEVVDPTIITRWTDDAITPWGIAATPEWIVYSDRDARRVVRVRRADGAKLVLASQNLVEPRGVAIDGQDVFFCDFGAGVVYRVPLDGAAPAKIFADAQRGALMVRADGESVYWTRYHPTLGGVYAKRK
jgi:hypothetical protein